VYGFVRFMNVKNCDKLSLALNNVWFWQFRVWAREASFDRFAKHDTVVSDKGKGVSIMDGVKVGQSQVLKCGEGEISERGKNEMVGAVVSEMLGREIKVWEWAMWWSRWAVRGESVEGEGVVRS
jgi:hypothetical protein